jgi:DNA-3-methyladenine glycosylase II
MESFQKNNFQQLCLQFIAAHPIFANVHQQFGFPPFWNRPLVFESVVKTILEQQVSLASAASVHIRLCQLLGKITPATVMQHQYQLASCGVTKQKIRYIVLFAEYIIAYPNYLQDIKAYTDEQLLQTLISHIGIGNWSAKVMMLVLYNRLNIYPSGDVALMKGVSMLAFENEKINNVIAEKFIGHFSPQQSIAVCYCYWLYICKKGIVFTP